MVDPALALVAFFTLSLLVALLVWPRRGLVARLRRLARSDERVRLEDALKHLHKQELAGRAATMASLAGVMEVSPSVAAETVRLLSDLGLVVMVGESPRLTDDGREYAVRILRTHRLWERYLADRTGIGPTDWHSSAEEAEHILSPEETDRLASRLGHPLYDPHGDPIPTPAGDMPLLEGVPLTRIDSPATVVIVHLEDEPKEVFDRLAAIGLSPHEQIEVLERSPRGARIRRRGEDLELDAVAAANVTVRRVAAAERQAEGARVLADAAPRETVRVVRISPSCQGPQRRRLLDLGVVPGTQITAELVSAGGDPVAYRIRGALIALRRDQASWVEVEPEALVTEAVAS